MDNATVLSPNPYILDFQQALNNHFTIVNKKYNTKGVLDFFKYIFITDIYLFHWLEDLPTLRFGKLQVLVFLFFVLLCSLFNKKIVWVLHNKYSHSIDKNLWTDLMYSMLMKHSNLVLTHSKSGIDFGQEFYPKYAHKIKYVCHPIKSLFRTYTNSGEKKYDFLIWGSISPYKGIQDFLKFVKTNVDFHHLKILIIGRCFEDSYKIEINPLLSKNIIHEDKFCDLEEIAKFASHSRFILFTHKSTSVLSSGSLIDSIRMSSRIIGPDIGAFKDLKPLSFIETYETYEDILEINKRYLESSKQVNHKELEEFYRDNSWERFSDIINSYLVSC